MSKKEEIEAHTEQLLLPVIQEKGFSIYDIEYIKEAGLTLLCTPGNDVESTTAMAGAGANVMLFTTGLGTPTGNPVVPVVKLSSNTKLAN